MVLASRIKLVVLVAIVLASLLVFRLPQQQQQHPQTVASTTGTTSRHASRETLPFAATTFPPTLTQVVASSSSSSSSLSSSPRRDQEDDVNDVVLTDALRLIKEQLRRTLLRHNNTMMMMQQNETKIAATGKAAKQRKQQHSHNLTSSNSSASLLLSSPPAFLDREEKEPPIVICPFRPGVARCLRDGSLSKLMSMSRTSDSNHGQKNRLPLHHHQHQHQQQDLGCCCSWRPTGPCASPIDATQSHFLFAVSFMPFLEHLPHTVDHGELLRNNQTDLLLRLLQKSAGNSCAGWDSGSWFTKQLPRDFLNLPLAKVIALAFPPSTIKYQQQSTKTRHSTISNIGNQELLSSAAAAAAAASRLSFVGPTALWNFGRIMKAIAARATRRNNAEEKFRGKEKKKKEWNMTETMMSNTNKQQTNDVFMIAGDSMSRQLFGRMVHMCRSRMCSNAAERGRPGVVEQYFHLDAAYVATTRGDQLLLGNGSCFEMLQKYAVADDIDDISRSSSSKEPEKKSRQKSAKEASSSDGVALFMMCFFWTPSWNGEDGLEMKLTNLHSDLAGNQAAAAAAAARTEGIDAPSASFTSTSSSATITISVPVFVYIGSVWGCMRGDPEKGNKCSTPEQNLFLTQRAAHLAVELFDATRVVIGTSVSKNAHAWNESYVAERNGILRSAFARGDLFSAMWSGTVSSEDMNRSAATGGGIPERSAAVAAAAAAAALEKKIQTRARLFDMEKAREKIGDLIGCDGSHGMCVLWPPRPPTSARGIHQAKSNYTNNNNRVTGITGACPGTGQCVDALDYDQVLMLMQTLIE